MTFIQDKKSIFVCVKNAFLHMDSSGLARKAELVSEQHCPDLFQTVLLHCYIQQAIQSSLVWHDSLLWKLGLNHEMFIFTNSLQQKTKEFFLLVFSFCFYFFPAKIAIEKSY